MFPFFYLLVIFQKVTANFYFSFRGCDVILILFLIFLFLFILIFRSFLTANFSLLLLFLSLFFTFCYFRFLIFIFFSCFSFQDAKTGVKKYFEMLKNWKPGKSRPPKKSTKKTVKMILQVISHNSKCFSVNHILSLYNI